MNVSLSKTGKFEANFDEALPELKCGAPGQWTFDYSVKVDADDSHLSPEGFVIENGRIQTYFDNAYAKRQPVRSCELIACHAARAIGKRLVAEKISVKAVSVTISGTPGANLTAQWHRPVNRKGVKRSVEVVA